MSSRQRNLILTILIVLTVCFIWGNSMLNGDQSSAFSNAVKSLIERILPGHVSISESGTGLLRKVGHFTEFTVLGVELTLLIRKRSFLPLFCGLLVALCDETIQLSSYGRSSQVTDVWIDFGGVVFGFLIVILITYIHRRRKAKKDGSVAGE